MALHINRRHYEPKRVIGKNGKVILVGGCPDRDKGGGHINCRGDSTKGDCILWVNGKINGNSIKRQTLDTSDYARAKEIVAGMLKNPETALVERRLPKIITAFLDDRAEAKAANKTLGVYGAVLNPFLTFCEEQRVCALSDVTAKVVKSYLESRVNMGRGEAHGSPIRLNTQRRNFDTLRYFLKWCRESKLTQEDPMEFMHGPKPEPRRPKPHSTEEVLGILDAFSKIKTQKKADTEIGRRQGHAITLLMVAVGLRIGDAFRFGRDDIDRNTQSTFIVQGKTDEGLWSEIPDELMAALDALPHIHDNYYFWNGKSAHELENAIANYAGRLKQAARIASVKTSNPHRFRRTLAQTMKDQGAELETIQDALGHTSPITTLKYLGKSPASQRKLRTAQAQLPYLKRTPLTLVQVAS